ncbi:MULTISPECIES: hypothetical protein [Streptomyces]|uniref:Uncharacterized protein n=1 Tax=Streptomyces lonegramiae TaxID=3075524 RepID=A0ABU2XM06_9ACTN|nr:hypothetical protein [Streptomyces sp. DSM 41529]MDT0546950.1 hypothetical protein [Streptomyces sp. DSM 41529]
MSSALTPERVELGKFFKVSARQFEARRTTPEMFSTAIDAEWHRLMKTPEYAAFCAEHAGQAIGHSPAKGAGEISWISVYEELFGPLPEIWFTGDDGQVDEKALGTYRESGVVVAEWDCSPVPGDSGDVAPKQEKALAR